MLGGEVKVNLLKQAWSMYHANQRQGTVPHARPRRGRRLDRKMFRRRAPATPAPAASATRSRRAAATPSRSAPKDWRQALPSRPKRLAPTAHPSMLQTATSAWGAAIGSRSSKTKPVAQMFQGARIDRTCLLTSPALRDETLEKWRPATRPHDHDYDRPLNAWDIIKNRTLL
jgi:ribosomal protein L4